MGWFTGWFKDRNEIPLLRLPPASGGASVSSNSCFSVGSWVCSTMAPVWSRMQTASSLACKSMPQ